MEAFSYNVNFSRHLYMSTYYTLNSSVFISSRANT